MGRAGACPTPAGRATPSCSHDTIVEEGLLKCRCPLTGARPNRMDWTIQRVAYRGNLGPTSRCHGGELLQTERSNPSQLRHLSRRKQDVPTMRWRVRGILPGFRLSLSYTLAYAFVLVVLPLTALFVRASSLGFGGVLRAAAEPRTWAALRLSFTVSAFAALVDVLLGVLVAWVLVRYEFAGRRLVDALVDLPFALPTAVAGIAMTTLFVDTGWLGAPLARLGLHLAFQPAGIVICLAFIGFPFVVRSVQPVLEDLNVELEEAAETLGATASQTFRRVLLPMVIPSVLTGFALAFARGLGEYGSVVFISGNMPMKTEIAPLLIVTKLEQYEYASATGIAAVMLVVAFAILLGINLLQRWARRGAA